MKEEGPYHVYPVGDCRPHELTQGCWCKPELKDGIYVHKALDGREQYESGERKPH